MFLKEENYALKHTHAGDKTPHMSEINIVVYAKLNAVEFTQISGKYVVTAIYNLRPEMHSFRIGAIPQL